jgi:hypothetical protein
MFQTYKFRSLSAQTAAIKSFAYHLWTQRYNHEIKTIDIVHDYMNDDIEFTLAPGECYDIYYLPSQFKDSCDGHLKIDIEQSEEFKGTGSSLMKWIEIILYVSATSYDSAALYIHKFVQDAIQYNKEHKEEDTIDIFVFDKLSGWRRISTLPRRSMDTIYLDSVEKKRLVDDVKRYVGREKEYIHYGIPYKRCYLFEGVHGSGKSSTIFAIASMLGKDINIFNFSAEITDTMFISAIAQTPSDRIIVLEDIDTLFTERSPIDTNHVSMSAFLNVLDGVCRKDKMMVFITTNHMDRLDEAILRPGRIDYTLHFNYVSKGQIRQMYDKFRDVKGTSEEFDKMYKILHSKRVNMSLVQKFLFEHKDVDSIMVYEKELSSLVQKYEKKEVMGII